jgi:hypothetical protein
MSDFEKNLKKSIGKFPATGMKKAGPDLSTPSDFLSRRKVLGGTKAILSGVLSKTPIGKVAKGVGALAGVGATAKVASDLSDDESYKEGREEGKKEGSDFKEKAKKEIGKKLGQVEGVINKSKGGSVIARGNKLARSKPTRLF